MNGSDLVEMTLNIGGESFRLTSEFNRQNNVREAEFAAKQYFNKLRRALPESSDKEILAMTAYQFAFWYQESLKLQKQAEEEVLKSSQMLDDICKEL